MCLIIVDCMPVGLDWVFTHDVFKFCTSHVHAFISFPFLSFLCYLVVMCSLSLSLSLSLSWIESAMAPKERKSTPARNPLSSRSSFSNPISSLHVWFHD